MTDPVNEPKETDVFKERNDIKNARQQDDRDVANARARRARGMDYDASLLED